METCPNCGERVYKLGCVNCNEIAYIEEQEILTESYGSDDPEEDDSPACPGTVKTQARWR